jgi:hypothetical protein
MTDSQRTRHRRAIDADKSLHEHAVELFILVEFDEIAKQKMWPAPSKKVLDALQQLAMDQFAAYQGRIGKVPD